MKLDYSKFLKKNKCVIFLFHGVRSKEKFEIINYTNKHISKKDFKLILQKLSSKGKCLSIDEVYDHIKRGIDFDDFSFAISFDDGFYNNYKIAIPILKKFKFPAVFYVTYNFIDSNLSSWTDQIEYIVENSKKGNFKTEIGNIKFANNKNSKIKFLTNLRRKLKKNRKINPYGFVDNLANELKFKQKYKKLNFSIFKKMNWRIIKKIHKDKLFTVGGHSRNHDILSHLNYRKLKRDLSFTIRGINKRLKTKIEHFSYPEGVDGTYGIREIKILKKEGIKICPSAKFGTNNKKTNLFNLKRINVT